MQIVAQQDVAVVGMHQDVQEESSLNYGVQEAMEMAHVVVIDVITSKVQAAEVILQKW